MALVPAAMDQTPESFAGKPGALHKDFFTAWAAQLGPPMDARVEAMSMKLLCSFGRATLGQMFSLTALQFDKDVAIASGIDEQAAAGVRMTIESILDRKFLPGLTDLAAASSTRSSTSLVTAKDQTVSATLTAEEMDAVVMPMPPRSKLETKNPAHATLKENDVKFYVQWAIEFILAKWGRINIGARLARRLGAQMDLDAPHKPDRGKVAGELRTFGPMLLGLSNNMLSAKAERVYAKRSFSIAALDLAEGAEAQLAQMPALKYVKIDKDAAERKFNPLAAAPAPAPETPTAPPPPPVQLGGPTPAHILQAMLPNTAPADMPIVNAVPIALHPTFGVAAHVAAQAAMQASGGMQVGGGMQVVGGINLPPPAGRAPPAGSQVLQQVSGSATNTGAADGAAAKPPKRKGKRSAPEPPEPPEPPSSLERKRQATIAQNRKELIRLGLQQPLFDESELAKTLSLLDHDLERFVEGQRVAIYYNDEIGWAAGLISAVQNNKKKIFVRFDGEAEEYHFPMHMNKYRKAWAFVAEHAVAAEEAAAATLGAA